MFFVQWGKGLGNPHANEIESEDRRQILDPPALIKESGAEFAVHFRQRRSLQFPEEPEEVSPLRSHELKRFVVHVLIRSRTVLMVREGCSLAEARYEVNADSI